jgi:hypothetical protein
MSAENSIAPMTRGQLADEIDGYDEQIAVLQDAKRELYVAYRAQLKRDGYEPAAVRAQVEAFKVAHRKRRAAVKNEQAVEEHDALVDEIYKEISSSRAPRATHAREDEVVPLPVDPSSNKRKEASANPDAVSQGHLSGPENGSGRSGRDLERQVNESFSMPIHIQLS